MPPSFVAVAAAAAALALAAVSSSLPGAAASALAVAAAAPSEQQPPPGLDASSSLATMHPAARALAEGGHAALGVGLSGSGFLAFFFIGALAALRDLNLIDQATTSFAGASGGAIVALASTLGCPYETGVRAVADLLVDTCERTGKSCFGTLDTAVHAALGKALDFVPGPFLPVAGGGFDAARNATVLARANGRTYVGVSLAPPSRSALAEQVHRQLRRESARNSSSSGGDAPPLTKADLALREQRAVEAAARARLSKSWVVSEFATVEDGIAAARASSFIPGFSGPRPLTDFRGRAVFDGMLTQPLPCPENVAYCLRVSAVPKGEAVMGITTPIHRADIAPGLSTRNGTGRYSKREWDAFTLSIGRAADRREVERMGYGEAVAWARQSGLGDAAANARLAARGNGAAKAAKERAAAVG
jgi:hypothetical protein